MSDIDLSLARPAADAEQKRAALEVENESLWNENVALRSSLVACIAERDTYAGSLKGHITERDLLEQERDMALHDRDRWHQRYLIATGQGDRQ